MEKCRKPAGNNGNNTWSTKWFQGAPCFAKTKTKQQQSHCTTTLWSCQFHMQACTHNARLLCGVASLHSLYKFNKKRVRSELHPKTCTRNTHIRNLGARISRSWRGFVWFCCVAFHGIRNWRGAGPKKRLSCTRVWVYHHIFFCPSTSERQAPRFSLQDPYPHAGAVSTHCSENPTWAPTLIHGHMVLGFAAIWCMMNACLASVSLPWLQPLAGSILQQLLHHCYLVEFGFPCRSTRSHSLCWEAGGWTVPTSLLKQINGLAEKKNAKYLNEL